MISKLTIWLFALVVTTLVVPARGDEVYSKTEQANRLYKQGNYKEALKLYEDALLLSPADATLKTNKGAALYKLGDFEHAEKAAEGGLSVEDPKLRAEAHYNMGNILYRQAEALQAQGDQTSQEKYKAALEHFIQTLDGKPNDRDAKWNLQLAHQRIKQLEQQQKQQQDQNNKDKKDNKDKQDQNKDQKSDQNKQDQNKDQEEKSDKDKQDQKNEQDKNKEQQDKEKQQDQSDKQQDSTQQEQQPPQQQKPDDALKKEEAKRLLELYADDADSLNKPTKKLSGQKRQPERDW